MYTHQAHPMNTDGTCKIDFLGKKFFSENFSNFENFRKFKNFYWIHRSEFLSHNAPMVLIFSEIVHTFRLE